MVVHAEFGMIEDDLPCKAVAVGVKAGRGEAEDDVARLNVRSIDRIVPLDHADDKTGHVEIARGVEVGQDGRFATSQRATGLLAAIDHSFHQLFRQGRVVLRHREVVEEDEWLRSAAEAVVDRHGDEVDADGVELVHERGHLEFGADAVGACDQDRFAVTAGKEPAIDVEGEQAGEAAEAVEDAGAVRLLHQPADAADGVLVHIQVQAGGLVVKCLRHVVWWLIPDTLNDTGFIDPTT
jgi:hypothetical protein